MLLEQEAGVRSRAGLHCAPHAHQALGTVARGGALVELDGASVCPDVPEFGFGNLSGRGTLVSDEAILFGGAAQAPGGELDLVWLWPVIED